MLEFRARCIGKIWGRGIDHDSGRMHRLALLYSARLGLPYERVIAFALAHAGLSASWDMDDGFDPGYRLKCIEALDPLVPVLGRDGD